MVTFHSSYWYNNGCLLPDLITVFVAVDKADIGNGCLKVLFVGVAVGVVMGVVIRY